ncbi:hypothetical protein PV08_11880 [Exophiala spinifera]|uniref:NAD-dependent epimerase/dehydratase domain-containing protein n=1 Tax=Exophiala spinifera TaxID=91928 RepID=A0A0D2ATD0_9EURO|nr:uncharacterized protein PV08_11880 [Exophiala spinifera]KIW09780.1 hypothetical protein PV08_11880 [Exophiala spinifera]
MAQRILLTGAGGYIGGTILSQILSLKDSPIQVKNLTVTVRSEEQVQRLSNLRVHTIAMDLNDTEAVKQAVLSNNIDVIVHIASALEPTIASHLIKALGERRKVSNRAAYFIHSSVTAVFSEENGWPFGEVRDTDPLYDMEKQLPPGHPVHDANILVTDLAKSEGVTSLIVVVPVVYGTGTGEFRRISSNLPSSVRASIAAKVVHKFDKNAKILKEEAIPTGEKGYYFAMAHRTSWWEVLQHLAEALYKRGLVDEAEVKIWPSDEIAAQALGWPRQFVRAMGTSSGDIIPVNAFNIGWQPKWTAESFLGSMDEEIKAVLEQGDKFKSTLYNSVLTPADK